MTSRTRSKVQAAEMEVLRLIKGVTRMDRIRNVDIRNELEIEDILNLIERGQLRWFGHVKRMENARYPRKVLEWQPDGTRPAGRLKKRWRENVDWLIFGKRLPNPQSLSSVGSVTQSLSGENQYMNTKTS